MRLPISAFLLIAAFRCDAAAFSYHIDGANVPAWSSILGSLDLVSASAKDADVLVNPQSPKTPPADWIARAEHGAILILEADSPIASALGFRATAQKFKVQAIEDLRAPSLEIIWQKPLEVARYELPPGATVFARERHSQLPLMAGMRCGSGAVLWIAAPPGDRGYERFPYLPQALLDLGLTLPFRSDRLWAFFDGSYRARVDLDYFAARWRESGIAALHVAAWHYWERDPASDSYLEALIQACHRHSILVYAWLEFPHVSERFWFDHPEWREKTALLQDAQLDWRKLINLTNRDAAAAVSAGLHVLLDKFDWDGVNLAEMYFESLEGHENPARFTPMNADVRKQFEAQAGFDPVELFNARSPHYHYASASGMAKFLEFRAGLAQRQEQEWIAVVDQIRKTKRHLDLALTHVDDRFDPATREKIGADASRTLPLLKTSDFTFLVEDPANLWNLGPDRYHTIATRYQALTSRADKLAIDINIVERYQDVYPTKQQTGSELFELIHIAASAFPRVALYFESSVAKADWPVIAHAASDVISVERTLNGLRIDSKSGVNVAWQGPASIDGHPWPVTNGSAVQVPPGPHTIEPAPAHPAIRITDLNADLKSAAVTGEGVELIYESSSRAFVRLNQPAGRTFIDGAETPLGSRDSLLVLPRGQHQVVIAASKSF